MNSKGHISIDTDKKQDLDNFKLGQSVKISAIGNIKSIREDDNYPIDISKVGKNNKKNESKKTYCLSMDLDSIEYDNPTTSWNKRKVEHHKIYKGK